MAATAGDPDPDTVLVAISVAADLVGTGVQNLRAYERHGLLEPHRTPGGTRLYSVEDVTRLRRITALLAAGLNLAGVDAVLELEAQNQALRIELARHRRRAAGGTPAEGAG